MHHMNVLHRVTGRLHRIEEIAEHDRIDVGRFVLTGDEFGACR